MGDPERGVRRPGDARRVTGAPRAAPVGAPEAGPVGGPEAPAIICERCGAEMYDRHCKVLCPNCGYQRDCSDP